MKTINLILLICSFLSISAQTGSTYHSRRDWFVGKYEGVQNKSFYGDTSSSFWSSTYIDITYGTNPNYIDCYNTQNGTDFYKICEDSIMIYSYYNDTLCDISDSVFHNEFGNVTYKDGIAKLFSDSTIEWWYYAPPAYGNRWVYFKGKKTESYVNIKHNKSDTYEFKIFPNPAKDNVQLIMNNVQLCKNTSVFIYDIYGRVVKQFNPENIKTELKINIADIEKGVYFVKVAGFSKKFVKM